MNKQNKITNSVVLVMGMTVFSLLFSFVKEAVFAHFYGASHTTDAYTIAVQIPTTLFAMLSVAISNVALPYYSKKLNSEGKEAARAYASNLMTVITLIALLLILVLEIFSGAAIKLFAPGLEPEAEKTAVLLFRLILPTVLLTQLININTAISDVNKSFVLPLFGSVILNAIYISAVCFLAQTAGIYAAVLGVIVGTVVEFAYSVLLRRRFVKYRLICNLADKDMIGSVKRATPVFIGIGVAEINKTIDTMISSFLSAGAVSMMNYASKLTSAVSSLLIGGITKVVYPEFAECAAKEDEKGMAESYLYSVKLTVLILFAVITGGALLNREIICLVYFRGAFDIQAVFGTAPIFTAYLTCLIFSALRQNSARVFYSYGDTKTPMINTFLGMVMNIALNLAVYRTFGAVGIAWATTATNMVVAGLLMVRLRKKNTQIHFRQLLPLLLKVAAATLCMAAVIAAGRYGLKLLGLYELTSFVHNGAFTCVAVIFGAMVYFGVLLLLKTSEVTALAKAFLPKKAKR